MNSPTKFLLGSAALLVASSLTMNRQADAYATLGFSLGVGDRDYRVLNDFNDSASNNNQTADANWPGYQGAEMALWKAGAEWGSHSFGDGSGDSTQNNLGDGGANFNFLWNGLASGAGNTGNDICSAPNVGGGGAIAWCYAGGGGWKIEYADNDFNFSDGPGTVGSAMCIQNVGCHELGHSLGLDHSNNNGATMYYATGNGSTNFRSINSDDKDGVQAIYGVLSSGAPELTGIQGSLAGGGTAVATGANFSTSNNRLWFNSDTLNSTDSGGDFYKLASLSSTNGGTQISFTVPSSGIETGGVYIKNDIGGKESLGNGQPFDYGGGSGGGGGDLTLSGPSSSSGGTWVTYSFTGATSSKPFGIYWSLSNAGFVFGGHQFDLGMPINAIGTGMVNAAGTGAASKRIPGSVSGVTVYIEAMVDEGGSYQDSNMITLTIN
ncbi:MAG: matrixin family metalloprotease [Planctomycetota bacterium]|nr:matrixin family metalloprotease [Planctomycetota bacterium]